MGRRGVLIKEDMVSSCVPLKADTGLPGKAARNLGAGYAFDRITVPPVNIGRTSDEHWLNKRALKSKLFGTNGHRDGLAVVK
jgi:hypothetical protein